MRQFHLAERPAGDATTDAGSQTSASEQRADGARGASLRAPDSGRAVAWLHSETGFAQPCIRHSRRVSEGRDTAQTGCAADARLVARFSVAGTDRVDGGN